MTVQLLDTAYGRMLVPDTDDRQFRWLYITGTARDDADIELVRAVLSERPRGTAIDVGASFGAWSLALAPAAARILAFEPRLEIYDMLKGTVALNRLSRVVSAHYCALWSRRRAFDVRSPDIDQGTNFGGVLFRHDHAGLGPVDHVEAYPLRDFVGTDEHVSFIKLDVGGSEYHVLLGALEIVARCRPVMFIEWPLSDQAKLLTQIEAMGYAIEERGPNFLCLPLAKAALRLTA